MAFQPAPANSLTGQFFKWLKISLIAFFALAYFSMVLGNVLRRQAREARQAKYEKTIADIEASVPTARELAPFQQIRKNMPRLQVLRLVGLADEQIGVGIPIERYKLTDGSTIRIGYNPRRVLFVGYFPKVGESRDLVENLPPVP